MEPQEIDQNTDQGPESLTMQANKVLSYLCDKAFLDYTPEGNIEAYFEKAIHYYHVRQALSLLVGEGYIEYARTGGAYKVTIPGRKFYVSGGYKN